MAWLALVLFSAAILGASTLMLKRDLLHEENTQTLALYSLSGVLLLALSGRVDYGVILTRTGWLIVVKAIILALAFYLSTLALQRLPVSVFAPLKNISPLFLLLFGWGFLGETVGPLQVLGLLLILGGALFLDVDVRKPHQVAQMRRFLRNPLVLLMLLYSVLLSFAPILDRFILSETGPATAAFWFYAVLSALYWIIHGVKEREPPFRGLSRAEIGWLALTGLAVIVADVALFAAIAVPGTILVVLIGTRRLSALFATVASGRLFHERNVLYRSAMCLVMIAGTVLLAL